MIEDSLYSRLYTTQEVTPRFYGLPKIHKNTTPLRPIVSTIGSVTYELSKFLTNILSPLVGSTSHHIANTVDFVSKIKDLDLSDQEIMVSYDVSALFTSVPVPKAVEVIKDRLERDDTLKERSALSPSQIADLLQFTLDTKYFVYRGEYYQQTHGAAMGSPVSPVVANLYMEYFEDIAMTSGSITPRIWYRYVDDTYVVIERTQYEEFSRDLNQIDPNIQFTTEVESDGKLPFLDTLVTRQPGGNVTLTVYKKPTHTDQYLNFASNHALATKMGIIRTLNNRAMLVTTEEEDLRKEQDSITRALGVCGYPSWATKVAPLPSSRNHDESDSDKLQVTLPYQQGLSEKLRRIFGKYNIRTAFRAANTIRSSLVAPKDKIDTLAVCGAVYKIPCKDCPASCIGESGRLLSTRLKEHKKAVDQLSKHHSAVAEHVCDTGHEIDWDSVSVLGKEPWQYRRKVLEAIFIKQERPSLNRDQGLDISPIFEPLIPANNTASDTTRSATRGDASSSPSGVDTSAPSGGASGVTAAGGH